MNPLKFLYQFLLNLVIQLWRLPKTIANIFEQSRRQKVRDELEVERLDRIRNPSKYRGK